VDPPEVAEAFPGVGPGLLRRHPGPDVVQRSHVKMEIELLQDIPFDLRDETGVRRSKVRSQIAK
jgi:hypothetical protein